MTDNDEDTPPESPEGNPGMDEDVIAWNLIQTIALASSLGTLDALPVAGIVQQALDESSEPGALVMALASHSSMLLRLYARAEGKELLDVVDSYGDSATLARLDADLEEDDDG